MIPPAQQQESNRVHQELQRELLGLSTNSRQVIATKAGHNIQREEPQLVIDAVVEVVNQLRTANEQCTEASAVAPIFQVASMQRASTTTRSYSGSRSVDLGRATDRASVARDGVEITSDGRECAGAVAGLHRGRRSRRVLRSRIGGWREQWWRRSPTASTACATAASTIPTATRSSSASHSSKAELHPEPRRDATHFEADELLVLLVGEIVDGEVGLELRRHLPHRAHVDDACTPAAARRPWRSTNRTTSPRRWPTPTTCSAALGVQCAPKPPRHSGRLRSSPPVEAMRLFTFVTLASSSTARPRRTTRELDALRVHAIAVHQHGRRTRIEVDGIAELAVEPGGAPARRAVEQTPATAPAHTTRRARARDPDCPPADGRAHTGWVV